MSRLTSPHKFGPIPSLIGKIRNLGRHNTLNKIPLFILPSLALSSLSIYFSQIQVQLFKLLLYR